MYIYIYVYIYTKFCIKRTIGNTTTAGINYKVLYDCKWDRMTLKNNALYTAAFKFL